MQIHIWILLLILIILVLVLLFVLIQVLGREGRPGAMVYSKTPNHRAGGGS